MSDVMDPDAILDWAWDWGPWLASGETLTSGVVTVPPGLTKTVEETILASGLVTVWLTGGTPGEYYEIACRVTTSQGRTDERTRRIRVLNR